MGIYYTANLAWGIEIEDPGGLQFDYEGKWKEISSEPCPFVIVSFGWDSDEKYVFALEKDYYRISQHENEDALIRPLDPDDNNEDFIFTTIPKMGLKIKGPFTQARWYFGMHFS